MKKFLYRLDPSQSYMYSHGEAKMGTCLCISCLPEVGKTADFRTYSDGESTKEWP
jgi:hypothetical protein